MTDRLLIFTLGVLMLGLAGTAQAEQPKAFSGRVDLGAGWMNTKSHLEPGEDNHGLESLDQAPKSQTEFQPLVFFELNYDISQTHRIYGGVPFDFENEPRPTLGWAGDFKGAGKFDISVYYSLPEEVWEDPYLIGVTRKETDQDSYGAKIKYGLGNWEMSYELEMMDVDRDMVGERYASLRRDGSIHDLELGYEIDLGQGFTLEPSLGVVLGNIDGNANRYKGGTAEIELTKHWDQFMFWAFVQAGVYDYDSVHPIFNDTRKDTIIESMAVVSWLAPFGYERFALSLGAGYEKGSSNINFYDSTEFFSMITVSCSFGSPQQNDDD